MKILTLETTKEGWCCKTIEKNQHEEDEMLIKTLEHIVRTILQKILKK
jgi:hypothetical protein